MSNQQVPPVRPNRSVDSDTLRQGAGHLYVRPQEPMRYHDGSPVALGDVVDVPVPSGTARARVVMLGETYEHLDLEPGFLSWVKTDRVLRPGAIVIEWLGENPFAHDDLRYAPVGNYMFTDVDEFVVRAAAA